MNQNQPRRKPVSRHQLVAAFAVIYLVWGSTYLAIRVAIQAIPPFLMAGSRFILAGSILYAWQRWKSGPSGFKVSWRDAVILGFLMITLGNGTVTFAEQKIPSGITALLIAGVPLWIALLDWLRPGGNRPPLTTFVGISVGFAGVAMLVRGSAQTGGPLDSASVLALALGSIAWSIGSVYSRHLQPQANPLPGAAAQMIAGGVLLVLLGAVRGEPANFHWSALGPGSVTAFFYLVIFGALLGFTTYSWLLTVTTATRASTYAYVNPVVAVILGALLGREPLSWRIAAAASIILCGVAIISQGRWLGQWWVSKRAKLKAFPLTDTSG